MRLLRRLRPHPAVEVASVDGFQVAVLPMMFSVEVCAPCARE